LGLAAENLSERRFGAVVDEDDFHGFAQFVGGALGTGQSMAERPDPVEGGDNDGDDRTG
jgi:hypothetical protein